MKLCKVRKKGLLIGSLPTGERNCITDVAGIKTAHQTISDNDINTGVSAILPHSGDLFQQKVTAATHVLNGFTKCAGILQINELGTLETPILLTNTLNVGKIADGTVDYMLKNCQDNYRINSVNPVVLECNDGYLNDINQKVISAEDVVTTIQNASDKTSEEGSVGAGTGMVSFGYKSGIGSASRKVVDKSNNFNYTVGTLVLANFGKKEQLEIQGMKVQKILNDSHKTQNDHYIEEANLPDSDGSIIMIIATDAPLESRQLQRLAKRAPLALARLGGYASHGSGELVLAFSNTRIHPQVDGGNQETAQKFTDKTLLDHPKLMDTFFQAIVEAIEESVLNSLSCSKTVTGFWDRTVERLPLEQVIHKIVNNPCG